MEETPVEQPTKRIFQLPEMPDQLKKDLKGALYGSIFIASPPAYFGLKKYNASSDKNWYEKFKATTLSVLTSGLVCLMGSAFWEHIVVEPRARDLKINDAQKVNYEFGEITFTDKADLEVRRSHPLKKSLDRAFFPVERLFSPKRVYCKTNERTEFEGTVNKGEFIYIVRGEMPLTKNVTAVTSKMLSENTYSVKVPYRLTQRNKDYIFGLESKVEKH